MEVSVFQIQALQPHWRSQSLSQRGVVGHLVGRHHELWVQGGIYQPRRCSYFGDDKYTREEALLKFYLVLCLQIQEFLYLFLNLGRLH